MQRFFMWPIGLLALVFLLYFAKGLLVPVLLAMFLAQLLVPLVARLERHIPRFLAILLSLSVVGIAITSVIGLVSDQVSEFQKRSPEIQTRLLSALTSGQSFAADHFHIDPARQIAMLKQGLEGFLGAGGQMAVTILGFTVGLLGSATLIAILAFLMLFYRDHIRKHLIAMIEQAQGAGKKEPAQLIVSPGEAQPATYHRSAGYVDEILGVGQKYTAGLLSVVGIIGALDSVGFLLMRAPFPILLGILGRFRY